MQILQLDGLKDLLSGPKKIFITTHVKPDGDAIGSSLGLYHFLIQSGHQVNIIVPSSVPDFLEWMPGVDMIIDAEKNMKQANLTIEACDIIFCLDFNRYERTHQVQELLYKAPQPKVLIDHHLNPDTASFTYLYSDPEKSSTCEMVFDFINIMADQSYLNSDVMQCLYTGLVTDTGSFRFPAVTAGVHEMAATFKKLGLQHAAIHEEVYDVWSEARMRLLGYLLHQKMVINHKEGFGYIFISKQELEDFKAGINDTEGIVNYIISIRGIKAGILITERKEGLKLSLRSKGNVNVSQFANENFGGGGHFNAAGATANMTWEATEELLKEKIPQLIRTSLN